MVDSSSQLEDFNIVYQPYIPKKHRSQKSCAIMYIFSKCFRISKFKIINPDDLGKIVLARRSNCILSTKKLEAEGITVPRAGGAVRECLKAYRKNLYNPNLK